MNEVVVCVGRHHHYHRPIFLATIIGEKSSVVRRPLEGADDGVCDNEWDRHLRHQYVMLEWVVCKHSCVIASEDSARDGTASLVILVVNFQVAKGVGGCESMARKFLALLSVAFLASPVSSGCSSDLLAVYRLSIRTFWEEEQFPKQYPEWRPPAQWSKTIGRISKKIGLKLFSFFAFKDFLTIADSDCSALAL